MYKRLPEPSLLREEEEKIVMRENANYEILLTCFLFMNITRIRMTIQKAHQQSMARSCCYQVLLIAFGLKAR